MIEEIRANYISLIIIITVICSGLTLAYFIWFCNGANKIIIVFRKLIPKKRSLLKERLDKYFGAGR